MQSDWTGRAWAQWDARTGQSGGSVVVVRTTGPRPGHYYSGQRFHRLPPTDPFIFTCAPWWWSSSRAVASRPGQTSLPLCFQVGSPRVRDTSPTGRMPHGATLTGLMDFWACADHRGNVLLPSPPAPNALLKSPGHVQPPSETTCPPSPCAASAHSITAESCGYPTPVCLRVVQTEPGPMPTWQSQARVSKEGHKQGVNEARWV